MEHPVDEIQRPLVLIRCHDGAVSRSSSLVKVEIFVSLASIVIPQREPLSDETVIFISYYFCYLYIIKFRLRNKLYLMSRTESRRTSLCLTFRTWGSCGLCVMRLISIWAEILPMYVVSILMVVICGM